MTMTRLLLRPFLCLCLFSSFINAQDPPTGVVTEEFDATTRLACNRGLAYLAQQQHENGSWTCKIGYKLYETYNGEDGEHVGVTALGGMAFLGAGHVPGRGRYGRAIERALQFVLDSSREEDGYITSNGTRMYSHAFATMFLAEICGMQRRDDVRTRLKRAVDLLVAAQNREGGWRYSPAPVDADLSVTVCTVQALRAARNVGVNVPIDTIDRAIRYVRRCASRAGFTYQATDEYSMNDARITFPLTACGIVSLTSAGIYEGREIRDGVRALGMYQRDMQPGRYHFYYGHYYAAQAYYLAGSDFFRPYYRSLKESILAEQKPDGGWIDDVGRNYATAMACIILQMPCEWLPIFQK